MYISDTNRKPKLQPPSSDNTGNHRDMLIEVVPPAGNHLLPVASPPKKRAEIWVQEETRNLVSLRKEMDSLFNTSKSNKHLWEEISARMRELGFDRSATMCTDKWRNLLKEYRKVKQQGNASGGNVKMMYYKDIDEIISERNGCVNGNVNASVVYKSPNNGSNPTHNANHSSKVDQFLQFSDKDIDDASIPFGPLEANGRTTLNLERRLEREGHSLAITAADAVTGGEVPPSFWQETPGNGDETHSCSGRVITIKFGDHTRRVGVDGSADAIKDVIRSTFGLRTKRAFRLEDEDQIVRSLDRDMPLGTYTLHLDQGITIKLCHYEESEHIPYPGQTISHTEEKTFYTEDHFREFMRRHGWSSLRELNGYRNVDTLDDLRAEGLYRGVS